MAQKPASNVPGYFGLRRDYSSGSDTLKASDLFIKALEAEGVEFIFGIPGEENLEFLNSLKDSSIQLILTRHEQAAGFMAATYGRLTGRVGVCLSTLGPGATNLVTAAAYAQLGAMPMMMITGQKPKALSFRIKTERFSFKRTAVSISCEFIMNPPSPHMASTFRSGKTNLAAMADGSPAPMVARALSSSTVFDWCAR